MMRREYCPTSPLSHKVGDPPFLSLTGSTRMAQTTKQGLDDVKLTLQRLQRIALDPAEGDAKPDRPEKAEAIPQRATGPAVEAARLATAAEEAPAKAAGKRNMAFGAAAFAAVIAVAGLATWLLSGSPPEAKRPEAGQTAATAIDLPARPAPAAAADGSSQTVAEAQSLLDAGKVTAARSILTEVALRSSEAALMLARSYDPNFLRQLAQPDAAPDPVQAERWYRAWREIATKDGLVMETDRLERIIKAMK
jgi:hypothetical protein